MKITISNLKEIFESILYMDNPEIEYFPRTINILGKEISRFDLFDFFRILIKKYYRENGSLEEFRKNVLDKYEENHETLSEEQYDFLYDIVDYIKGNCPFHGSLDDQNEILE